MTTDTTIHGSTEVFEENGYWRWRITDSCGVEFLDGGNYRTREMAATSLADAFDCDLELSPGHDWAPVVTNR